MPNQENYPISKRLQLHRFFMKNQISGNTELEIIQPIAGLQEEEKEKLADKLLAAISECKTEEEMIEAAKQVKL